MKKTLITLLALSGVAVAESSILSTNFITSSTADFISGTDGWMVYGYNSTYPTTDDNRNNIFDVTANGIINMANWNKSALEHAITLDSSTLKAGQSFQIVYTTYSNNSDTNNVFFLSSSSYSLTLGQSYNSNKDIVLGQLDSNAANTYPCYQNQTGNLPTTLYTATPSVDPSNSLTYTIYISSGKINGSVTDGTITGTFSAEIAKTFSFDTIGFSIDGASGNAGVKNISISVVPEPTTATLSLLALAGLAARRRRK